MENLPSNLWEALGTKKAIVFFWSPYEFGDPPLPEAKYEKVANIAKLLMAIIGPRSFMIRHRYGKNAEDVKKIFLEHSKTSGHGPSKLLAKDQQRFCTLHCMTNNMFNSKDVLILIMDNDVHIKNFLNYYIDQKGIDVAVDDLTINRNTALVLLIGEKNQIIQLGW